MEYYKNLDLNDIVYFCEDYLVWKIEQWKCVVGFEGFYKVSDLGRIKSLERIVLIRGKYPASKKERILISGKAKYLNVDLARYGINKTRTIHQLVAESFLGHEPCGLKLVINHKNFNKHDNRACNLEIVTSRENCNMKHIKSSSQYTGVSWHKGKKRWQSYINVNGRKKHLGKFKEEFDAHLAYENELTKIINGSI